MKNDKEKENCDIIQASEEIYDEIKDEIKERKDNGYTKDELNRLQVENYELEKELKNKDKIIKRERFINIRSRIAKTTHIILIYIYNKYKEINLFNKKEISEILFNKFKNENLKIEIDLETKAIIQFLLNNKLIDTEDDEIFSVTELGEEFLKFLFEGGC